LEWVAAEEGMVELWSDSCLSGGALKVWLQLGVKVYRLIDRYDNPHQDNLVEITMEEAEARAKASMNYVGKDCENRGIVFKYEG
jgi:hypothetical protein